MKRRGEGTRPNSDEAGATHPWTHRASQKPWVAPASVMPRRKDTFGRALKQNPANNKETTGGRNAIHQETTRSR